MVETIAQVEEAKDIGYYMNLSYPIQLVHDKDGGCWIAEIPDFPGCMSDGKDPNKAVENVRDAKELWIETCIEDGYEVPMPTYADYLAHLADDRKEVAR